MIYRDESWGGSVVEAAEDGGVGVDAAVAEEWPPAAHLLAAAHVDVDDGGCLTVGGGVVKELALRLPRNCCPRMLYHWLHLTGRVRDLRG